MSSTWTTAASTNARATIDASSLGACGKKLAVSPAVPGRGL
jgi:hypothetical protein